MEIIWQLNDGFIITRVKSELFIVDQHAADEKYNFEQLQSRAKIDSQPLIMPQPLHLGAVNEAIITDNSHVFIANGFNFSMDHDGNFWDNSEQCYNNIFSKSWTTCNVAMLAN